ncbi:MAG: hypothetical protein H0U27_03910 [Nitrosopumilus sp.]|nr:hypothetical protein [Nitrosopumilus sp.]
MPVQPCRKTKKRTQDNMLARLESLEQWNQTNQTPIVVVEESLEDLFQNFQVENDGHVLPLSWTGVFDFLLEDKTLIQK